MTRRILREHTFKLLFLSIFRTPKEMDEQIELYRQEYGLEGDDAAYVIGKVKDILNRLPQIDGQIETVCDNWKLNRIGKTELTVLRLAVYEISFEADIPKNVSISEAVEIAKRYGGEHSGSFVNGVLAKI